jgi:polar amino acid transport system substrate-binding protein
VVEGSIRLGVLSGAAEDGYAVDSGVPENRISRFDTTADMVDALVARRIGAFALTAVTVRAQTADLPEFEATQGFVPVIGGERQLGCGGYVFRFEDKEFRDEFNRVLHGMKQGGEILPLVESFGFGPTEIDPAKDLTVADLIGKPYDFATDGRD